MVRFKERIRQRILKNRGLVRTGQGHLAPEPKEPDDPNKTLAMRLIEDKHGAPIEELLMQGSIKQVGEDLGIDETTVSKWRLRLGLRV